MRYTLKQDLIGVGDDYTIRTEDGDVAFRVDGRLLALGDKLVVEDPAGDEIGRIEQHLISLVPSYRVSRGGETLAVVKKRLLKLIRDRFVVDVPGPDDFEAVGSFLDHDYVFKRGGRTVATVSKAWLSIRDSYGVEIEDGEDDFLILASAVVIDLICHDTDGAGD